MMIVCLRILYRVKKCNRCQQLRRYHVCHLLCSVNKKRVAPGSTTQITDHGDIVALSGVLSGQITDHCDITT